MQYKGNITFRSLIAERFAMKSSGNEQEVKSMDTEKKSSALFDRYRNNASLHGTFYRAFRLWKEAIRKNQWR
jgi:hypothetical protein